MLIISICLYSILDKIKVLVYLMIFKYKHIIPKLISSF
nr:MAG TPA: hypothetical protein [Caudoviricetes sp.]